MMAVSASRPDAAEVRPRRERPIVYACAGCSFAGRLTYDLAQELDRRDIAQMSCLAGLAADLPYFQRQAEGRRLWIIDGCPLECSREVFRRAGRRANADIRLHELGIQKNSPPDGGVDVDLLVERALVSVHLAHTTSPKTKGTDYEPDTAES